MKLTELRHSKIHLLAFAAGVVLVVLLTRMTRYLPSEYYFSFAGFLYSADFSDPAMQGSLHWLSLAIKLLTPVVAGFIIGSVFDEDGIGAAGPAGFSAALLLCWPGIVEWELIAHPDMLARRNQFLVLYALYIGSFAYLCAAGARLGPGMRRWLGARFGAATPSAIVVDWGKIVNELIKSAILGTGSFVMGYVLR